MFHRLIKPLKSNSFFLFGARGTGKTTFLRQFFKEEKVIWIDLLDPIIEDQLTLKPESLSQQIKAKEGKIDWVVLDEVQKIPRLLDIAHHHIETSNLKFALTGSSARKLKRGAANLLAGRAFVNHLFPLTHIEMGDAFDEMTAMKFGTLPKVTQFYNDDERVAFLKAYALTYLKEEVWAEHIVRNLEPFRKFLEIAAQSNGEVINYTNIARDVGADTKTVQSYFQILEDTLIGFLLEPYYKSVRKQQRHNPKFYFFDIGVKRALDRTLTQELVPNTYGFGKLFEHLVIVEAIRLNDYKKKDYKFYYLLTKDRAEIDLIVERPGLPTALVEIKSANRIDERSTNIIERFVNDMPNTEGYCLSRDPIPKRIGSVSVLPWLEGLQAIGL
jgi:predicted AAA+ superfamily ATPase